MFNPYQFKFLPAFLAILLLTSLLPAQQVTFSNVAAQMGIQHIYQHSGVWGGGVSFCDFDGDGRDDLTFASKVGEYIYCYRNETSQFLNMAAQMNITDPYESQSVLWVDYDNDGDKDLFVANFAASSKLYRNEGNGLLQDMTGPAGLPTAALTVSAACWADYDNDGYLDLYLTNRSPLQPNRLFRNQGDGTFADVTTIAGVDDTNQAPLAVSFIDYDNDGWQDIYIANDRGMFNGGNTLFRNNGDGTFSDVTAAAGADLRFDVMGIAIGDYDNNGYLDIYVTNNPAGNGLLHNNGDGTFTDVAGPLGMTVGRVCWGTSFIDYDNDSDLDLYVCVSEGSTSQKSEFFINNGDATFTPAVGIGMDGDTYSSFASAIGDFDNNGYSDIAVLNEGDPSVLWKNSGGSNNWIKLTLEGTVSNRDAVGSRVEIHWQGQKVLRSTHCGISYHSQDSPVLIVGVGAATAVDSVTVIWPSGSRETVYNLPVNQRTHILENSGAQGLGIPETIPGGIMLYQNYPNPFNPATVISYQLSVASEIELGIFDVTGRLIRTLVNSRQPAGFYAVGWDGRDARGVPAASGVYLYRLETGRTAHSGKMILLR